MARIPPCASRQHRRAPQLASHKQRGLGSNTRRARTPMPAAMLGRAIRGEKEHPCQGLRWVAHLPVARAEYRSPSGSIQASPCSSRAAYLAADELASARSGEERRKKSRAPGIRVSLVTFFARAKKVTLGRGRSIPDSNNAGEARSTKNNITPHPTPLPQGDKMKSRPKGGFDIQTLDPGFRRGDSKENFAGMTKKKNSTSPWRRTSPSPSASNPFFHRRTAGRIRTVPAPWRASAPSPGRR